MLGARHEGRAGLLPWATMDHRAISHGPARGAARRGRPPAVSAKVPGKVSAAVLGKIPAKVAAVVQIAVPAAVLIKVAAAGRAS
ncbi:hypothetical protein Ssi03_36620 [Sphaerisporangium siamense]|nr:hypothetical protein Ssi03_36620 [Sphaerisporangium siamense]